MNSVVFYLVKHATVRATKAVKLKKFKKRIQDRKVVTNFTVVAVVAVVKQLQHQNIERPNNYLLLPTLLLSLLLSL